VLFADKVTIIHTTKMVILLARAFKQNKAKEKGNKSKTLFINMNKAILTRISPK